LDSIRSSDGAARLGHFDDRVAQAGSDLGLGRTPGELDADFDAALGEVASGEADQLGGDALALEILRPLVGRVAGHRQYPAGGAEGGFGVDEVADHFDVRSVFRGPVLAGDAAVEGAEIDISRHLLSTDQRALDLFVIDAREVAAIAGAHAPARLLHEVYGGVLEAALGQSESENAHFL
jgi:hypothetical protein